MAYLWLPLPLYAVDEVRFDMKCPAAILAYIVCPLSLPLLRLYRPLSCAGLSVHRAILWTELETGLTCRHSQYIKTGVCLACFTLRLHNTPCFMNWWIKFICELCQYRKAWLQSPSQEEERKSQALWKSWFQSILEFYTCIWYTGSSVYNPAVFCVLCNLRKCLMMNLFFISK